MCYGGDTGVLQIPPLGAAGTHRACKELSWLKVSAPISQIRLCRRPLEQQERRDEPAGPDSGSDPRPSSTGRKRGEPPTSPGTGKKAQPAEVTRIEGSTGDPVALGKWVRRQSHKTIPVAQKGVSFQGSHRAWLSAQLTAMGPADPSLAADTGQSSDCIELRSRV